jgi:hypothetical protein
MEAIGELIGCTAASLPRPGDRLRSAGVRGVPSLNR